ncbi:hypothetical protein EVAR_40693_1 [Eumeta japonica]|uniref:Uncharacterized protein n=1 Tax=Eumeta variegata TaxID=151549 RepID=A0A4C1X696_EUMVA|nr:hypothetical protein EVAR_40693_1 [Eumeta japonica]
MIADYDSGVPPPYVGASPRCRVSRNTYFISSKVPTTSISKSKGIDYNVYLHKWSGMRVVSALPSNQEVPGTMAVIDSLEIAVSHRGVLEYVVLQLKYKGSVCLYGR